MKKALLLLVSVLLFLFEPVRLSAQVPMAIPYQAIARDASGNLLVNQAVGIRFSVLTDSPSPATIHYQETHAAITTDLGQINLSIGGGTVTSGTFSAIPWADSNVRLQVEMDPSGGSTYTVSGVTVFGTVPYAFRSGSAGLSGNGVPNGTAVGQTLRWNGTAWEASSLLMNNGSNISINAGSATPDLALSLGDNSSLDGGIVARGQYFTGSGVLNASGSGTRLIWYPRKAAFRAGHVSGTHWNEFSIGDYSFAGGADAIASGQGSVAIGTTLNASGQGAVALGSSNQATGYASFAGGIGNNSSGFYATSFGGFNIASGNYSFTIGELSEAIGLKSFAGGQQTVSSGAFSFSFGYADSATGNGAVAMGYNSKALGVGAVALGTSLKAVGNASFAAGHSNQALQSGDVAFGYGSIAEGGSSFSAGFYNKASDDFSIAMGAQSLASGYSSISMGYGDTATANSTIAIGRNNLSISDYAVGIGNNNVSSGISSFSIGTGLLSRTYGETAIGIYNTDYSPTGSLTDRLFVVGNGMSPSIRSNALVVLKNGNVGIGENVPSSLLSVGSGNTFQVNSQGDLARIKNISYTWPAAQGAANQFLKNDGSGNLSWANPTISASDISSGTLSDSRLSANVAMYDKPGAFSREQSIEASWISSGLGIPALTISYHQLASGFDYLTEWKYGSNTVASLSCSGLFEVQSLFVKRYTDLSSDFPSQSPLNIRGNASQTAPLTRWLNSSGTVIASVSNLGVFTGDGSGLTNLTIPNNAVTSAKILDGTITDADINSVAAISATKVASGTVDNTEFGYLDGVASGIQTQLNGKLGTTLMSGNILVGNASNVATSVAPIGDVSITNSGILQIGSGVIVDLDISATAAISMSKLTALNSNRALVSNASGVITGSAVTSTELGYLSGVTSSIQNQLNAKAASSALGSYLPLSGGTMAGDITFNSANGSVYNGTSGSIALRAPTAAITSYTLTLPSSAGSAGQILSTDATGNLSWIAPTGGTVTSVATGSGLTGGPITGSGTISVASGGIASNHILDGTIATADIADAAVTSLKVADGTIATADLADGSVTSAKVLDGTIATADLANAIVTSTKIADNSVSGAKLALGSDALGDLMYYNGTDYVRLAAGTDGQVLKMSGGVPAWTAPTGMIANTYNVEGTATNPTSTLAFLSPTVTIAVSAGQKVLLNVNCALGANGAGAAQSLNIYPGYRISGGSVTASGGGIYGLSCPVNIRQVVSINGLITGLAAGTYNFGMIGNTTSFNWTNNEYCYVTAVVIN